jgi:4-amino-4-deoxy-L-arabinose transferase-like glycosyltransferase
MNSQWRSALLFVAIIVAVVAQLPAILRVRVVEYDEAVFMDMARNIQRTGVPVRSLGEKGIYDGHVPLYVYLLSLYAGSSVQGIFIAWLITSLFGLGSVLLVFLIGERLAGTLAGFVAALLLAVNPLFALYSFFIRMEIPSVFMSLVGLLAWLSCDDKAPLGRLILAGAAFALAALFREFSIPFAVYCSLYSLVMCRPKRPILQSVVLGLPAILAFVAWLVWLNNQSPSQFQGLVARWVSSSVGSSVEPRQLVSVFDWGKYLAQNMLGVVVSASLVVAMARVLLNVRDSVSDRRLFFAGYVGIAVGSSFFISLKEPRHLIEVIPMAALLIALSVDWDAFLKWARRSILRKSLILLGLVIVLILVSPVRVPFRDGSSPQNWFEPTYAHRVFNNDPYYNILRVAGLYILEHTSPDERVTVVHEATVTGYYADRHYEMLYTLPLEQVFRVLIRTRYLVWDDTVFLRLSSEQIKSVESYVTQHCAIEQVIRDAHRQVAIYHCNSLY